MNKLSHVSIAAVMAMLSTATMAAEAPVVQAVWQPQEFTFQYMGFTTAYNCDALADKIEGILKRVGAREGVRVSAGGCIADRPQGSISVRIAALVPVPQGEASPDAGLGTEQRNALLQRLGVKPLDNTPFAASWRTVEVPKDRSLQIGAGDCELLEQLRDRVFPKLHVKIVEDNTRCTPHQANIVPPRLTVSALLPLKSADVDTGS